MSSITAKPKKKDQTRFLKQATSLERMDLEQMDLEQMDPEQINQPGVRQSRNPKPARHQRELLSDWNHAS